MALPPSGYLALGNADALSAFLLTVDPSMLPRLLLSPLVQLCWTSHTLHLISRVIALWLGTVACMMILWSLFMMFLEVCDQILLMYHIYLGRTNIKTVSKDRVKKQWLALKRKIMQKQGTEVCQGKFWQRRHLEQTPWSVGQARKGGESLWAAAWKLLSMCLFLWQRSFLENILGRKHRAAHIPCSGLGSQQGDPTWCVSAPVWGQMLSSCCAFLHIQILFLLYSFFHCVSQSAVSFQ